MASCVDWVGDSVGPAAELPPALAGEPAAGAVDGLGPPLTNRGSESAGEGRNPVLCHLDYLKVTVYCEVEELKDAVRDNLRARVEDDWPWTNKGPADRWAEIWEGPGPLWVLKPKDERARYCMLDLKGQGCATYGDAQLFYLLGKFTWYGWLWHAARVDVAFDHVGFTPHMVDAAIRAGNLNSRMTVKDRDWNDSEEGQTVYLGKRCDRKPRVLRVYNRRGFTRCELELRRPWAEELIAQAVVVPLSYWPALALGALRSTVDFVDRHSNQQAARCELLPWWAEFVGNVDKMRLPALEDTKLDLGQHPVGMSEGKIQRCCRSLWPIVEAFGAEYLASRIRHHAFARLQDSDRAFAERLKDYRNCGLAGLDGDAEAVPF